MSDSRPSRTALRISPAPFKSSFLAIPPSPFSPRTPLTPIALLRRSSICSSSSSSYSNSDPSSPPQISTTAYIPAAPAQPLSWQWTCHQCRNSYPLSATRRCLDDGHLFCSGTTTVKSWRKPSTSRRVKKHRACASEFDYSGWKAWARWRREIHDDEIRGPARRQQGQKPHAPRKDCWNTCTYPSECRWGKRYGVHTPIESVFPTTDLSPISTAYTSPSTVQNATTPSALNRASDVALTPTPETRISNLPTTSRTSKDTHFWTSLLASAERRKAGTLHIASPLCVVVEETETEAESSPLQCRGDRDTDGDTAMSSSALNMNVTPTPNLSSMRSSLTESGPSQITLRALWTRNKKTASSPLRYRRRSTSSGGGKSTRGRVKRSRSSDAGDVVERGETVDLENEEFGAPLVRVRSRGSDSGYGSCV
ncbi:hypothetical protein NX059_005053 [Plenodomus lindquistii]|nr:hypothetical protein NX059_005053 [Plenodomus lindquistii]